MKHFIPALLLISLTFTACSAAQKHASTGPDLPSIIAVEPFLADIAQQVAGDRFSVETLIPGGVDPHSFEMTPRDAARLEEADVLIINGGGLEEWLEPVLQSLPKKQIMIVASEGLTSRPVDINDPHAETGDPHYWLNPINVVQYAANIRDGFIRFDPAGADVYASNADAYAVQHRALDEWIIGQVETIPVDKRLLVTNHESLGYFADRYGFQVVGAVMPSVSSGASPSAKTMADLVNQISTSGAKAIFLEVGANPELAEQIASETGAQVVTDLYTHSFSAAGGPVSSYLELMQYDTLLIVEALK